LAPSFYILSSKVYTRLQIAVDDPLRVRRAQAVCDIKGLGLKGLTPFPLNLRPLGWASLTDQVET